MSLNRIELIGYLGRDPEEITFESGTKIVKCSIATTESWTDKEGNTQEDTQWHNLVWFGKAGEVVMKWLKKGSRIYLDGKSTNRSWDGEDGKKVYMHEIKVNKFEFLDSKGDSTSNNPSGGDQHYESMAKMPQEEDDDLPF